MCYRTQKRLAKAAKLAHWRLLVRAQWGSPLNWHTAKHVARLCAEPSAPAMAARLVAMGCPRRATMLYDEHGKRFRPVVLFQCPA